MSLPITQRCARCGESWWDSHVCPQTSVPAAKPVGDAEALRLQRDQLAAALRKVLDARELEARTAFAYANASANFSHARAESKAHTSAMVAASAAEKEARLLLATLNFKL